MIDAIISWTALLTMYAIAVMLIMWLARSLLSGLVYLFDRNKKSYMSSESRFGNPPNYRKDK
jgi:hypothetical protein